MKKKDRIKSLNKNLKSLKVEVGNLIMNTLNNKGRLDMDIVIDIQDKQNKIINIEKKLKFLSQGKSFIGSPINTISIKV